MQGTKQGYLLEDFRLFRLSGHGQGTFAPHYHDFCKILFFYKGEAEYLVEGRTYTLVPGDLVLVNQGEIHCPQVRENASYERALLYLSPAFLEKYSNPDALDSCFQIARHRHSNVIRLPKEQREHLFELIGRVERELSWKPQNRAFGAQTLARAFVLEFLVELNRAVTAGEASYLHSGTMDFRVSELIAYIGSHLEDELSIATLSKECHLSPYHMMRLFKEETGCTIADYITKKRLGLARGLLLSGQAKATQACYQAGFSSYSSFFRAYKKEFGQSPKRAGQ